jgi:hypothetical protein
MSTGTGKWVALGLIFFILLVLVPFGYQKRWVGKYVLGDDREHFDPDVQKIVYAQNWKGWRDILVRLTRILLFYFIFLLEPQQ